MSDISFYTSSELVDELVKRVTFAGVIIRSETEVKSDETVHNNWDITYAKLSAQQVHDLLQDAVEHFRQLAEAELNE
jgi:hypothetical protein